MKRRMLIPVTLIVVLLLLLAARAVTLAQTSSSFDLRWNVLAGGGGESTSAGYRVAGTYGQAMTGPPAATGGSFHVTSGFWIPGTWKVYLPLVLR